MATDCLSDLTLPKQMSSTMAGSTFILSLTSFKSEYTMKSSDVSFMPPFLPFVNGVLMANVMTISSGFFAVLLGKGGEQQSVLRCEEGGAWRKDGLHSCHTRLSSSQMRHNRPESLCSHFVFVEGDARW
jgi:hypothetical protein